jgi:hypothetical protein
MTSSKLSKRIRPLKRSYVEDLTANLVTIAAPKQMSLECVQSPRARSLTQ